MAIKVHRPVAWQWPISSEYGFRIDPVTKTEGVFHAGTDFAVPEGTPVVAALDGIIHKVGWQDETNQKAGFGLRVWQTTRLYGKTASIFYAHLSEISVQAGQSIIAGTRVGLSGSTGKSSGPHLHFEVRPSGEKGVEVEFI